MSVGHALLCIVRLSLVSHFSTSASYPFIYDPGDGQLASKMPYYVITDIPSTQRIKSKIED